MIWGPTETLSAGGAGLSQREAQQALQAAKSIGLARHGNNYIIIISRSIAIII